MPSPRCSSSSLGRSDLPRIGSVLPHAHRDLILAGGAELGPVPDHWGVEIEFAALGEQMGADRGCAFGGRCDLDDRVFVPRTVRVAIGESAPQVDDRAAVRIDADGGANLAGVAIEVRSKRVSDLSPAVLDVPLDACSGSCAY